MITSRARAHPGSLLTPIQENPIIAQARTRSGLFICKKSNLRTTLIDLTYQGICREIPTTGGEGCRQVAGAAEEVAEEGDAVGDIEGSVVVAVGGVLAADGAAGEEVVEGGDGIADVDASIAIHIAADERGFLTLIRNAIGVGIGGAAGDIATVDDAVGVAIFPGTLIDVAVVEDAVAVNVVVARYQVHEDAVGLASPVCDPSIEIAIAVEVTEGDIVAIGVAESLAAVCEVAQSVIDPHAVTEGDVLAIGVAEELPAVGEVSIEIAIAIEVTEGDTIAKEVAEGLAAVQEVACSSLLISPLVDPHTVWCAD